METYLLWSPSLDEKGQQLSFLATAVNIQRIAKGTSEMIGAMLAELGVRDVPVQTWTINRFITNYLTDDPDSDDWQDSWAETWEIIVQFNSPVPVNKDQYYPRRSFEVDRSWDGNTSIFPVECVVIANFDSQDTFNRAQQVFEKMKTLTDNASVVDELKAMVPEADADLFEKIRGELLKLPQKPMPPFKTRTWHSLQLLISLGTVEADFFESGAQPVSLIAGLCQALGGTTTHEETRDA